MYNGLVDNYLFDVLGQFILNHYAWRHFIIALGVLIQGEITLLISMYLILNKYLGWGGFLLAVGISLFVYETFFYFLGRYLKDTPLGLKIEKKIPHYAKVQFHIHNNATTFLILSKFVVYLNLAILILSGWAKVSFAKFLKHRLTANAIWLLLNSVIYLLIASGFNLLRSAKIIHQLELVVVGIILLIIFGSKRLLKNLIKEEAVIEEKAEVIGEKVK